MFNLYTSINNDTESILNINKNLINIITDITSFKYYLNFEYLTTILRRNYKNLIFIGNKKDNNQKNYEQYTKNVNNIEYLNNINNNLLNKIKKNKNLLEISTYKKNNNIFDKNETNIYIKKDKIFNIEKINKTINANNNINNNDNNEYNYLQFKNIFKSYNTNLNDKIFFNNEKQVKKYNKTVYMNKFLLKKKKNITKKRISTHKRSSKFRGVSKNGAGWQVLLMFNNNRPYIGTYHSEELAARIYDIASIKKIGIKSKTNFSYNSEQIDRILKANIDYKNPNISTIISEIIL